MTNQSSAALSRAAHPSSHRIRVVVVGAGYAGLMATNRLLGSLTEDEQRRVEVTVVNPRDVFVERVRLHQLVAGSRDTVTTPLQYLLHPSARLVTGHARRIDRRRRALVVSTARGDRDLPFRYLVCAAGSTPSMRIPGAAENAFGLGEYDGARAAREALRRQGPDARIAVIGGGLTGVEAATEIAEQHPDAHVTLYSASPLLPGMRPRARRSVERTLRRLGVTVEENTTVVQVGTHDIALGNGEVRPTDICLLAASFGVPELAELSGLPVDHLGRLRVDEHLRCLDDPAVIGAGDAVLAPPSVAAHLRMSCAAALPMGGQDPAGRDAAYASVLATDPPNRWCAAMNGWSTPMSARGRGHRLVEPRQPSWPREEEP